MTLARRKTATKSEAAYQDRIRALGCVEVREALGYDPQSGDFTWKVSMGASPAGAPAGWLTAHGYRKIKVCGVECYAHRLAWVHVHGEWPKGNIDHINGDRLNNRIANLRECDQSGNMQNQLRVRKDNRAGLSGVSWDRARRLWQAGIQVRGDRRHLGRFHTPEEAHAAYLKAKAEMHPFSREWKRGRK